MSGGSPLEASRRALSECIEDLKEWGALALSSDYSGPQDREFLERDIARHMQALADLERNE